MATNNAYRWVTELNNNIECDMLINKVEISIWINGSITIDKDKQYQFIYELNKLINAYSLERKT